MSSCDEALREYYEAELDLADAHALLLAAVVSFCISFAMLVAGLGIAAIVSPGLAVPGENLIAFVVFIGGLSLATLGSAGALTSAVAIATLYVHWQDAMRKRRQRYDELFSKCQGEDAQRIPPPPVGA